MSSNNHHTQHNPIKTLRKERRLSQLELARAIGVEQAAVSKWELWKCSPDKNSIIALARFFNVSADQVIGLESERRAERVDLLRDAKAVLDETVKGAKSTGLPAEFLYSLFSLGLPRVYYAVTYLYRQDVDFRRIADAWHSLGDGQKKELAVILEDILNRPVAQAWETGDGQEDTVLEGMGVKGEAQTDDL
jgi:transcriptional regulator with XRE-family HTH domain